MAALIRNVLVFQISRMNFLREHLLQIWRSEHSLWLPFHSLLFSNTNSYIRLDDVHLTEVYENIGNKNWCEALVNDLSRAARSYRIDFTNKGVDTPITGCCIFLMISIIFITV